MTVDDFVLRKAFDFNKSQQLSTSSLQQVQYQSLKNLLIIARGRAVPDTFPTNLSDCRMSTIVDMGKRMELLQGTLDLLILKALALEPMHGWAISQRLRQISDGVLSVQQGSLYPALQRLELQGWILSEWRSTEGNRRARFYSLSRSGRGRLEKETADWQRFTTAVQRVLRTT